MRASRRDLVRAAAYGLVGVALPVGVWAQGAFRFRSPATARFAVPLPIPPILAPVRAADGADHYEVAQRPGAQEILPGRRTTVWGYEGAFPGPTIEARRGRPVVVAFRNELPVPTAVHLHGGVVPPEHDGYPTDLILPPGTTPDDFPAHAKHGLGPATAVGDKVYRYPNDQPAATLWYHDHRADFTGPQVYRGLAGLYLLRDEVEDALPLPRGEREVPLVIADRLFAEDGSFFYPARDPSLRTTPGVTGGFQNEGVLGDTILVNGAPWPVLEVANVRYRFRILNASNARRYELALDPPPGDGPAFVQIGSDGGLLAAPQPLPSIPIAPAERFDVVVDFGRYPVGAEVTLRNRLVADPFGVAGTSLVMRFTVARAGREESDVPARLAPDAHADLPDPARAAMTRRFTFGADNGMWTIDGEHFDPARVLAIPRLNTTEVWEFSGSTNHPVHLHLVHFRVLARNGRAPHPADAGWKDTVFLGEDARVVARFGPYRGKYVFHCHNLEHEDMMMMANFEVV